jgi:hypothetical protein
MLAELYDALKDAGANEKEARKAAETVAVYKNRFATIETDVGILKRAVDFNLAGTVSVPLYAASSLAFWHRTIRRSDRHQSWWHSNSAEDSGNVELSSELVARYLPCC